jgi:hypothetical protein
MASGAAPNPWDNLALADKAAREAKERFDQEQKDKGNKPRSVVELEPAEVERIRAAREEAIRDKALAKIREEAMPTSEKVADVGRSAVTGVERGIAAIPGSPVDIFRLGQLGRAYADYKLNPWADPKYKKGSWQETLALQDKEREEGQRGYVKPSDAAHWNGDAWIESASRVKSPVSDQELVPELRYKPTTTAGRIAQGAGEVVGGGVLDPALGAARAAPRIASRALLDNLAQRYARELPRNVATGTVAATVGEKTENPVAAIVAGAATGTGTSMLSRQNASLRAAFGKAIPNDVTDAEIRQAEDMFQDAQRRGLSLSRPNALDQVTGGRTRLSELQRVTESSGAEPYRGFYSGTEGQVERAGTDVLNQITPPSATPSLVGQRAAEGANQSVQGAIDDVNRATRPQYAQIDPRQTTQGELQRLMQDEAFADAYQRVMTHSDYADRRAGLPPDSVGVIDLVRRDMESRQTNLTTPGGEPQVGMNPTRASGLAGPIDRAQEVASMASRPTGPIGPQQPGVPTPLEEVQRQQAILREQNVDPLQAGPEGRAARQLPQATTQGVVQAFFPKAPLENSHHEVARAVGDLYGRNPQAARELVRNYLGTELQRATTVNIPGEPYTSGAGFSKNVTGNPQQHRNIQAALQAINPQAAQAFDRLIDIFDAMGKRQHPGSKTAFNTEDIADLKKRGWTDEGIKAIAGIGTSIPRQFADRIERIRLGQNVNELADLFTNPAREADFRNLALTRPGTRENVFLAMQTLARLGVPAAVSRDATRDDPGNNPIPTMRVPSGPRPAGGPR